MDRVDKIVRNVGEIGVLWDVLPDEHVGVFDKAFLPGGVRMSEEYAGMEPVCNSLVPGELSSVVRGDGLYRATSVPLFQ